MSKAIIFDTETTGLDVPEIIEAVWLELRSLSPLIFGECFEHRYKPSKSIGLAALAIHHILDEELTDCPPSASFNLPEGVQYLIGHNVDFDWAVIGSPNVRRVCTLNLARAVWPELESIAKAPYFIFWIGRTLNSVYGMLTRQAQTFEFAQRYLSIFAKNVTLIPSKSFGKNRKMLARRRTCPLKNTKAHQSLKCLEITQDGYWTSPIPTHS